MFLGHGFSHTTIGNRRKSKNVMFRDTPEIHRKVIKTFEITQTMENFIFVIAINYATLLKLQKTYKTMKIHVFGFTMKSWRFIHNR